MPALKFFGSKQHYAADDLFLIAPILAVLHGMWTLILFLISSAFHQVKQCKDDPAVKVLTWEASFTALLFAVDVLTLMFSLRGAIFETSKRRAIQILASSFVLIFVVTLSLRIAVTVLSLTGDGACSYSSKSMPAVTDLALGSYRVANQLTWAQLALTAAVVVFGLGSIPSPGAAQGASWAGRTSFVGLRCFMQIRSRRDPLTGKRVDTELAMLGLINLMARDMGLVMLDVLAGMMLYGVRQNRERCDALKAAVEQQQPEGPGAGMPGDGGGGPEARAQGDLDSASPFMQSTGEAGPCRRIDTASLPASVSLVDMPVMASERVGGLFTPPEVYRRTLLAGCTHQALGNKERVAWRKHAEAAFYCKFAAAAYATREESSRWRCSPNRDPTAEATRSIREAVGLPDEGLCHVKCGGQAPYFIAASQHTRTVVLAICSSGSVSDLAADTISCRPVPLAEYLITPFAEVGRRSWGADQDAADKIATAPGAFSGYCSALLLHGAEEVIADLASHGKLHELLISGAPPNASRPPAEDIESAVSHGSWRLVVTGHSLGAGVAALVALKLQQSFPRIRAWCFSPPGSTVSPQQAQQMDPWCTSVVVGKDMVPRLSLQSVIRLRERVAGAITYSKANKWRVFRKHYTMKESPGTLFFGSLSEIPSECAAQLLDVQSMLAVDLERRGPVVEQSVPGRVLLLRPQPGSEIAGSTEGVWLSGEELKMEGILLSYEMVKVHPVAEAYLWLLNSLACAQLEGATGVAIDEVPHQKASSAASGLNRGAARLSSSTLPMHRSVSSTGGRASSSSGSLREIGLRLLDFWDPDNNDGTPWLQHGSRSLVLAPLGSRNRDPPMTTLEETETPQE